MKNIHYFMFHVSCFVLLLTLPSCKPKQLIIHDIQYRDRLQVDSVTITKHDSILITRLGDTVLIQKFNTLYRDRFKLRRDTINQTRTVTKQVDKIVKVEKSLSYWQSLCIALGKLFLMLLCIACFLFIVKYVIKLKLY